MNHDSASLEKDLNAFKDITAKRLARFASASDTAVEAESGVNILAAELHPDRQELTVNGIFEQTDGSYTVFLSGKTAFFRPGQYVNVLCGDNLYPLFLSGSPEEALNGRYELTVPSDDPSFSFFSGLENGDTVVCGAPSGYFYHQPLRDGKTCAVIADYAGKGAALSMRHNGSTRVFICENENDFPSPDDIEADTVFICGKRDFCKKAQVLYSAFHVRVLYTDIPSLKTERVKFTCTVSAGDDNFSFDCFSDEPLIFALERNGVRTYNKCRTGDCSFCRARLVSGNVNHIFDGDNDSRRRADIRFGYIHPCRAFPESDIVLKY